MRVAAHFSAFVEKLLATKLRLIFPPLVLLAIGLFIRLQPSIYSPLDQDELLTVKRYAGVDYSSTMEQMRHVSHFNINRAARGVVKCFFSEWDPNNHIVYSLLITASNFFFGFSELTFRLPALVASLLLVVMAFYWIAKKTDSVALSFVCSLLLLTHPYFIYYGQNARGYTVTALLFFAQILLIDFFRQRKPTLGSIALQSMMAVALFLNLVSMLAFWLVPLLLLGWVWAATDLQSQRVGLSGNLEKLFHEDKCHAWLMQIFIAGFVIVLFIACKLRELFISQDKYGVRFSSTSELVSILAGLREYLLPGFWLAAGILGPWACWPCCVNELFIGWDRLFLDRLSQDPFTFWWAGNFHIQERSASIWC